MKRIIALGGAFLALSLPLSANEAAAAGHGTASGHEAAGGQESSGHQEGPVWSPLTAEEAALVFDPKFRRVDAHGAGYLEVEGEPLTVDQIAELSPWDLMELVQTLSGHEVALSRFGTGRASPATVAWRLKVAAFASAAAHHTVHEEDPFDPALVLWDPGYIQKKNEWDQWYLTLDRRSIVEGDLPTLSPLEVQQAVQVLTGRVYPVEYVLEHLESFRAQLSVVPRVVEAVAAHH